VRRITADHVYGTADHVYGTADHVYGTADHVYGTADHVYGTADHVYGTADGDPADVAARLGEAARLGRAPSKLQPADHTPEPDHPYPAWAGRQR